MKKFALLLIVSIALNSCDLISKLPTGTGTGVTEAEAGEGVKEALGQGLIKAVLQLNKEDGFFKDAFYTKEKMTPVQEEPPAIPQPEYGSFEISEEEEEQIYQQRKQQSQHSPDEALNPSSDTYEHENEDPHESEIQESKKQEEVDDRF